MTPKFIFLTKDCVWEKQLYYNNKIVVSGRPAGSITISVFISICILIAVDYPLLTKYGNDQYRTLYKHPMMTLLGSTKYKITRYSDFKQFQLIF